MSGSKAMRADASPSGFPRSRVKVPTVLQMEETECGAACLGMVLDHYGRRVPLSELREACGVTRDGSKASNMLKAARDYGLEGAGYKRPFDFLAEGGHLPQILFWRYSHWVVLEGYGRDCVYINDPAEGRQRVPTEEARRDYSGVALTCSPGPGFVKGGTRNTWLPDLLARLRPARVGFILAAIAGLFLVVPGVLLPILIATFVNTVLAAPSAPSISALIVAVLATALLTGALTLVQQLFLARLQTQLTVAGSFRFVDHLLHLPIKFFTQRFPGVLVSRLDQIESINTLLAGPFLTAAVALVGLLLYLAVMIAYSPLLAAIGVVASLLNVVALAIVSRRRDAANQLQLRENARLAGLGMSTIGSIESIKSTGSEDAAYERWAGYQARYLAAGQDLGRLTNALSVVPTTLSGVTSVLVLTIGGLAVMYGHLSLGVLVGFQALLASFLAPVAQLVFLASQTQTAQGQLLQVNDVLANAVDPQFDPAPSDTAPSDTAPPGTPADTFGAAPPTGRLEGALELCDVDFGYSKVNDPFIRGFSLRLRPGSRVALVGASGSGKSTIVRLILGLHEPWRGQVLYDGRPRTAWNRRMLTTSMSFVDQQIMLFDGTIHDNLTMWDDHVSQGALIAAARDACIHDDIISRTGGYESAVEAGGRNFSGGERQRLEIARALTTDPSIVVLDEATSALDSETEHRIDRSLRRRGVTSLIVAHRLSTIRDCDQIIVLDGGRIVQQGTHVELIAEGGLYATLVEAE